MIFANGNNDQTTTVADAMTRTEMDGSYNGIERCYDDILNSESRLERTKARLAHWCVC